MEFANQSIPQLQIARGMFTVMWPAFEFVLGFDFSRCVCPGWLGMHSAFRQSDNTASFLFLAIGADISHTMPCSVF